MTAVQTHSHFYSPETYTVVEKSSFGRADANFSRGSLTVGDYRDQIKATSTSYLFGTTYESRSCVPTKHRKLQELLTSWINEPGDNDIQEWNEIEKELKNNRLKLPNDI